MILNPIIYQWIDEVTGRINRDLSPQQLKLIEERNSKITYESLEECRYVDKN